MVWYSHLFKNFLQFVVIHTVKGFSIVNEAEELFWNSLAFSMGLPGSSDGKESTCNAGDLGSLPGLGISPGEGKGYPLQYSGLENSMDCIEKETVTTTSFYIATNKKMNVSKTRTPNKKIKQVRCSRWRLKN